MVVEASKVAMPAEETIKLKKVEDFKFIGKTLKSVDLKDFTHGTATYGIDVRIPNMKFAAIASCCGEVGLACGGRRPLAWIASCVQVHTHIHVLSPRKR